MGYVIAKYIRKSVEDAKTGGLSIPAQRGILDTAIAGLPEKDIVVREFVDDGHTGTNFERPQLQEMLEMVRHGEIDSP